jgi:capsular exopolysaccharide synthesis family protein
MADLVPGPKNSLTPTAYSPKLPALEHEGISQLEYANDEIDLREVMNVLRRHVKLIIAIGIAAAVLTAVYVMKQTPQYKTLATVRITDVPQSLTSGIGTPQEGVVDQMLGKSSDPLLSEMEVLHSRTVLGEVVDRVGLRMRSLTKGLRTGSIDVTAFPAPDVSDTVKLRFGRTHVTAEGDSASVSAPYGQPVSVHGLTFTIPKAPEDLQEGMLAVTSRGAAIDDLTVKLGAVRRENTNVVDIEYMDASPRRAALVANTAVEAFQEASASAARKQSERKRVFLEEQLAATDSILDSAQSALERFRSSKQLYSSSQQLVAEQTGLLQLDAKLGDLSSERSMFDKLLTQFKPNERPQTNQLLALLAAPGISDNAVISQLGGQLAHLVSTRDSLMTGGWGNARTNPDMIRLDTMINSTQARIVTAARSHLDALDARILALQELKNRSAQAMSSLPKTESEELRLSARVDAMRKVADQIRQDYQIARVAEAVEAGQVETIDPAPIPLRPVSSRLILKVAMALVLGLIVGMGSSFLMERMNNTIRQKEDIEKVLHLPGLAVIPQIVKPRVWAQRLLGAGGNGNGNANGNGKHKRHGAGSLVTVVNTRSSGAEAYRTLRTNLIFSQALQRLRSLVVSSPSPADGKTTTAANLGVTFAQQGMRVLLIDADLRRASMHEAFNISRAPGFTDVLLKSSLLSEAVRTTEVDNLFVLPAGALPPNPAELLGSTQTIQLLKELDRQYDLIIIDSPPLLAASDALVLGRLVDGVLLVVKAGFTDKGAGRHAVAQLASVGARVVGVVLNDPEAKVPTYSGYYYYSYYHYYGHEEDTAKV